MITEGIVVAAAAAATGLLCCRWCGCDKLVTAFSSYASWVANGGAGCTRVGACVCIYGAAGERVSGGGEGRHGNMYKKNFTTRRQRYIRPARDVNRSRGTSCLHDIYNPPHTPQTSVIRDPASFQRLCSN